MADPRRPVGRPRLDSTNATTKTSLTLRTRDYDRLCKQATRDGISLAAVIRRQLQDDDRDE
jgi:hypothetical protein